MADQNYCELMITNTMVVDPDTEQGQEYLQQMAWDGHLLMPEADARAMFPQV